MKRIEFLLFVCLLMGCSNNQMQEPLQENENTYCIYVDKDSTILTDMEAWDIFEEKIGNKGENTKTEYIGIEIYKNRIYYYFRTFEDSPIKKTVTGNYTVDVYTGEVYYTDLGEWVKLD